MTKSKRVAFTFDARSFSTLEKMTEEGQFSSMAETVRESLQISHALQEQARDGFSEIIVRNPKTGAEKVVVVPHLQAMKKS